MYWSAAALLTLMFGLGCGPAVGGTCRNTGQALCFDGATAMECRFGVWTLLPCRGSNGCRELTNSITCDMSANRENDNCAVAAEGTGLCAADGKAVLQCRDGALRAITTCATCAVENGTVRCRN